VFYYLWLDESAVSGLRVDDSGLFISRVERWTVLTKSSPHQFKPVSLLDSHPAPPLNSLLLLFLHHICEGDSLRIAILPTEGPASPIC